MKSILNSDCSTKQAEEDDVLEPNSVGDGEAGAVKLAKFGNVHVLIVINY